MKKLLFWFAGLLLILILLTVGLLTYITATDSGLQTALIIGKKIAPGYLQWSKASGRLTGPLELENFRYQQENGLKIFLQRASFNWQPKELLSRRLRFNHLRANGIDIHLPKPTQQQEEPEAAGISALSDIHLPIEIESGEIDFQHIRMYPYGAKNPIEIERVQLVGSAKDDTFTVKKLYFKSKAPKAQAQLRGTIQPIGDYPVKLNLDWQYEHPEFSHYTGHAKVTGDLSGLQLTHDLEGAAQGQVIAKLTNLLKQPTWDADINITVDNPSLFTPQLENPIKSHFESKGNLDHFIASGRVESELAETGPFDFTFNAQGNTAKIKLEEALFKLREQTTLLKLYGDVDIESQAVDLKGNWESLRWPLTTEEIDYSSPKGQLEVRGSSKNFTAQVKAVIDGRDLIPLNLNLQAKGINDLMTLSKLSLHDQNDQLQLNLTGDYHLGEQRFQATGAWKGLAWPLSGDAQFASPTGEFNAEGLISDYVFRITADAGGSQVPKGHWNLDGKGSDQALDRFTVNGKTLDGVIKANGKATWEPKVTWQITLAGEQLNPGSHWPDLPGNLTAKLKSTGKLTADGPDLNADIEQLSGKFRGQKVHGKGHIEMQGEMLDVNQLNINIGKTQFSANGQLGNRWDLNWQLASPDLTQLAPDLSGSIKADGALTGTPTQPEGSMDLDIRKLSLGENRIKRLKGKVLLDLSGAKQSKVNLRGSGLVLGGQQWNKLKFNGSGTPEKHKLNFNLKGELAQLEIALNGGLQQQQWVGQLTQLAIRKTEVGDWVLKKPAQIRASQSQAETNSICLSSKPTLFCLSGNWDVSNGSQGRVKIKSLEANRFQAFLPEGIKIDTTLNGDVTGSVNAKGEPQAQVDLTLRPGSLSLDNNGEPVNIKLGKSLLKASLQDENGSARLTLDLGKLGEINAQAGITDWQGTQRLSGSFKTRLNDLTLISTFVPQLQSIEGSLKADLQLGGTIKTPSVLGELRLADFAAEVPEVAIHIKDTQLTVHSDGKGPLLIKGSSRSGKGTLALSGQIDPVKKSLKLNVKGENFHASNSTLADVEISPDLKLSMNSKGMKVDGKVVIPKAHINARGAGGEDGIVSTSSDVVIIDEEGGEPEKEEQDGNLNLNVRVVLGKDIKVDAADFNGSLEGNLLIEQTPRLPPSGTGTIKIINGDFLVYGQQLKMQRGQILFSGGPIDNPRLDMDVARRVEQYNVLAGAKIRGTAQAPLMQLYSEPSMPDASILSYILIGQPPGAKAGTYTLGKYITPDLYVSYGIALFNAISSFNMRYKLTDKLSLKAASGAASSADLIYTIER